MSVNFKYGFYNVNLYSFERKKFILSQILFIFVNLLKKEFCSDYDEMQLSHNHVIN
jgi:hypothetical protein